MTDAVGILVGIKNQFSRDTERYERKMATLKDGQNAGKLGFSATGENEGMGGEGLEPPTLSV